MHEKRRTFAWIGFLVLLLIGPPAGAQHRDGRARQHIELGERYYKLSDYPAALREFQAAYRLDPRPDLLFNVARCHEVMANLEDAIHYYQRYLQLKPGADDREVVELRIRNLQKRVERTAVFHQRRRDDPPAPRPGRWRSTAGWTAVGLGVALLVTGTIFGVLAEEKASEFTSGASGGMTYTALMEIEREGEQYQRVQVGTLIAGGLVAAAGGGLLLLDLRDRRRPRTGFVAPLIGASVGLAAGGSF